MRYFITGATGFIGTRLALQLREAGHEVVALARDPGRAGALTEQGVQVVPGDVTERESMREPMRGVDGVFHVAGWYKLGERDTRAGTRVNVDGTRNVLELMRDLQIPRGVYTSSLAVFSDTRGRVPDEHYRFTGTHLTAYDRSKWQAHYEVAEPMIRAGLPLTVVLPGVVYGPGDPSTMGDTFRLYLRRKLPAIPAGATYAWGYVDDMARGHVQAMERGVPGESYIIAGPLHTLAEALRTAQEITGIPAPRLQVPPLVQRLSARLVAPVERFLPLPASYRAEALRASAGVTYVGSSAKAARELGFTARSLTEGLRLTLPYELERLGLTPAR